MFLFAVFLTDRFQCVSQRKQKCQPFTWGGCQGSVPFQTKRECNRARCKPTVLPTPKPLPLEKRCALQPNAGPCKARKRRWFWNSSEMVSFFNLCIHSMGRIQIVALVLTHVLHMVFLCVFLEMPLVYLGWMLWHCAV